VLILENFYNSILEEMDALNESQVAFLNIERSLMLQEHNSIINEGISDIGKNVMDAIRKILKQVRDIIMRLVNWVKGQFSKFINAVRKEMEKQKKEEREEEDDEEDSSQPSMGGSTQKGTVDDGVDYDLSSDLLMLAGPSNPSGGNSFTGAGKKKSPRGKRSGTTSQTSGPKRYNSQLNILQSKKELDNAIEILFRESKKIFVELRQVSLDEYKVVENRVKLDGLRHQVKDMMMKSTDFKNTAMQDRPTVYTAKDYDMLIKLKNAIIDSMESDRKSIEKAVKMLQNSHNGLVVAINKIESKESADFAQKKYESYYTLATTLLSATSSMTSSVFGTAGKKAKLINEVTKAIKAVK
jgi:hypothetical protein